MEPLWAIPLAALMLFPIVLFVVWNARRAQLSVRDWLRYLKAQRKAKRSLASR